jgi:hypothetical protein
MKTKSLVILFILFAGLVLMSYLAPKLQEGLTNSGPTADLQHDISKENSSDTESNEEKKFGSDIIQSGTSLYGPNGEICQILVDEKNKQYLEVRDSITKPPVYYHYDLTTTNKFTGPNGSSAEVYLGVDNQPRISITDAAGNTKVFSIDGTHTNSNNGQSSNTNYNPAVDTGFTGSPMGSNNYNSVYSTSLPRGIPASQIVPGSEDLYILKTQVVPPVCPACPRCPQPSLDCKKKSNNNQYLPHVVLNDYTSFGM